MFRDLIVAIICFAVAGCYIQQERIPPEVISFDRIICKPPNYNVLILKDGKVTSTLLYGKVDIFTDCPTGSSMYYKKINTAHYEIHIHNINQIES